MSVWRMLVVSGAALAAALGVAACGDDDHPNEPRPPAPIELTARINDRDVIVSPSRASEVGAGPATIVISNQSEDPAELTLEGPTDDVGPELPAGGVGQMKTVLEEGDYEVTAGTDSDAQAGLLAVGPERPSSQNDLMLP
jgi:hypothetical protein